MVLSLIALAVSIASLGYNLRALLKINRAIKMLDKHERPTEGSMRKHFEPILVYNKLVRSKEAVEEEKGPSA